MKKGILTIVLAMICATSFAATDLTRSRNLSKTAPKAGYMLGVDANGRWNVWLNYSTNFFPVETGIDISNRVVALEIYTNNIIQLETFTNRVIALEGQTGLYEQAATDASDWTNNPISWNDINACTNFDIANLEAGGTAAAFDGQNITALDAANLTAGTVATAIDGSAITNIIDAGIESLSAAKLTAATVATAIDINAATNIDMANLAAGTTAAAFDGQNITALDAANITAGTVASAIDINAATNIDMANLAAGTTAAAFDGSAITALDAANLTAGTVATAIDVNAATNFDMANLAAGTTAAAFDGQNITNLSAANLAGNVPYASTTNAIRIQHIPAQLIVTNTMEIAVTAEFYVVFGQGQANGETNELDLSAPGYGGRRVTFMGGFVGHSNKVSFPTAGTMRGPATLHNGLDRDDSASFMSIDNSTWVCTGHDVDD